jgi:hypothetical protein
MGSTICPACRLPMEIAPEMAGQAMACPRCGAQFVIPPAAGPAPPPIQPAAASTLAAPIIRRQTVRRPFQDESTSLLDLSEQVSPRQT